MTQPVGERQFQRLSDLGRAVNGSVSSLQRRYLSDARDTDILGRLARLRQSLNREPGTTPEVWDDTLALVPETPSDQQATPRERAVCIAVGLYAFHQQGRRVPVHVADVSMGHAARRLIGVPDDEPAIRKRLQAIALADTEAGVERHARSMISLLKSADPPVALDYGRLTDDLAALYRGGRWAESVRLQWGRDFVRQPKREQRASEDSSHSTHTTEG
ncbi:type I-E CRISPR-associated protein Cse2/CasB [Gordonia sp. VNQ95]|uniref:type I-E CRISPR-associated protein Cse2/CasB n=1 Tax=Gordonia TaxID=2053 RepID=UPI0032B4682B